MGIDHFCAQILSWRLTAARRIKLAAEMVSQLVDMRWRTFKRHTPRLCSLGRHVSRQLHASEVLLVVSGPASGPQVRRPRRTSELDEKLTHCVLIILLFQEQVFALSFCRRVWALLFLSLQCRSLWWTAKSSVSRNCSVRVPGRLHDQRS